MQQPEKRPERETADHDANRKEDPQIESLRNRLNLQFLVALLIISGVAFFYVVRMFFTPVVLALSVATLFYSMYEWIVRRLGGRRAAGALLACFIILLGLIVPITLIGSAVTAQIVSLVERTDAQDITDIQKSGMSVVSLIDESPLGQWLASMDINWKESIRQVLGALGNVATTIINRTSAGIFGFVTTVGIMLFTLFYFFRDGRDISRRIMYLSPLRSEYELKIVRHFSMIARATLKGTVIIGMIQGTLGAITLLVFGINGWILWGVVMLILAIIPMLGPALVLVPIGILQIIAGRLFAGIAIIVISTFLVSMIDNLIRPYLVGHQSKMHDLLIFFSTLGGIAVFGILGFIVGPVIAALFTTILSIYGTEFREPLSTAEPRSRRRRLKPSDREIQDGTT